jgi:heme exporter protein A
MGKSIEALIDNSYPASYTDGGRRAHGFCTFRKGFMRLTAQNMSLERGGRRLFSGVSFAVQPGEALVVTGPNGAGKSSLLRALAGFLPISAGQVTCDGLEGAGREERIHYLGHLDALKGALTAAENLAFWGAILGSGGLQAADALARMGLAHVADLPVRALSAGQKRRVALARLLVAKRPLWLLDEPTTALDAAAQRRFADLMQAHLGEGGLVVAATHAPLGLHAARSLALGTPA